MKFFIRSMGQGGGWGCIFSRADGQSPEPQKPPDYDGQANAGHSLPPILLHRNGVCVMLCDKATISSSIFFHK